MFLDFAWIGNIFPPFIFDCSSGWLINITNPIRLQHCIPWQPLYQSGSQRLQLWLCWLSLLLLRPLPLGIRLGHPYLRLWFKCWEQALAVYTLPCNGLWQPGWVTIRYISKPQNNPRHRCCHLSKLPWWLSQQHFEKRDDTSGARKATDVTIHCIQHSVPFQLSLWLPDNQGCRRDDSHGKDLWLRPA